MVISVSGALLQFVEFRREHTIDATTVIDGIEGLTAKYPNLKDVLFDDSGQMRSFNAVYINRELATKESLTAPASKEDRVEILTAIAGG